AGRGPGRTKAGFISTAPPAPKSNPRPLKKLPNDTVDPANLTRLGIVSNSQHVALPIRRREDSWVAHPLKRVALMRILRAVLLVVGLVVLAVLVVRVGLDSVLTVLGRLSWWQLVLVFLPYGLIMPLNHL